MVIAEFVENCETEIFFCKQEKKFKRIVQKLNLQVTSFTHKKQKNTVHTKVK